MMRSMASRSVLLLGLLTVANLVTTVAAEECSAEETECNGLYLALFFGLALCIFAIYALIAASSGGISIMMLLECFDYTGNLCFVLVLSVGAKSSRTYGDAEADQLSDLYDASLVFIVIDSLLLVGRGVMSAGGGEDGSASGLKPIKLVQGIVSDLPFFIMTAYYQGEFGGCVDDCSLATIWLGVVFSVFSFAAALAM